ncbi:hypothetical protein Mth01_19980 [Sphaerimonospora thailandensis]|uniref:DUF4065 domain-containing protein n=1 Tax=Sphaerimonospora thailandensis TaxID=795644 RepID=A0A8J3R7E6_9ACTN|nr:hypothetical protein Mth01_19980 [Sphaerimonospora thailandensis]
MVAMVESPTLLVSAVLAVLKTAQEMGFEITKVKLTELLYLADLKAVEEGLSQLSGATWRWDHHGPYDHAIRRAEEFVVESELVERDDSTAVELGSGVLRMNVDIDDPLDVIGMMLIRDVVRMHGAKSATALKELSYATAPVIEAQVGGERGVLLDLNRARRRKQTAALIRRVKSRRARRPTEAGDPGAGEALKSEFLEGREALQRANSRALGEQ